MRNENIASYISGVRRKFEQMLKELVEIPTVSADPAHRDDIHRAAHVAEKFLRLSGAQTQLVETPGNPVILGRFEVNGARGP